MTCGEVRELDAQVTDWFNGEAENLIAADATSSLRWRDVYRHQLPSISFSAAVESPRWFGGQSYVVGNVTASSFPLSSLGSKEPPLSKVGRLRAAADDLHAEKMERISNWLRGDSHWTWKPGAVKMCAAGDPVIVGSPEEDSRLGNSVSEVRASGPENDAKRPAAGGKGRRSSGTAQQSEALTPLEMASSPRLPKQPEFPFQNFDMPERDENPALVSRLPRENSKAAGRPMCGNGNNVPKLPASEFPLADDQCRIRGDNSMPKLPESENPSAGSQSRVCHSRKMQVPVDRECERPLFSRFDATFPRSCDGPAVKRESEFKGRNVEKPAAGFNFVFGDHPSTTQKAVVKPVRAPEKIGEKSDHSTAVSRDLETATSKYVRQLPNEATFDEEYTSSVDGTGSRFTGPIFAKKPPNRVLSCEMVVGSEGVAVQNRAAFDGEVASSVVGLGCDRETPNLARKPANRVTLPALFAANMGPSLDVEDEGEACSESSLSQMAVAPAYGGMESDAYLTAEDTPSSVSVTPRKRSHPVSTSMSAAKLFAMENVDPAVARPVDDKDAAPDDCLEKPAMRGFPPIQLEIPESRRLPVLVSEVESLDRFWVNVASERILEIDRVTDELNSRYASLKPVAAAFATEDLLHLGCCVMSPAEDLVYRAEVIEICYGDSICRRGSTSDSVVCACDQMLRLPTVDVKAVRVSF